MKNPNVIMIGGAVVVLLALFGGLFFVLKGKKTDDSGATQSASKKKAAKEVTPEAIGLQLTPISNNQKIRIQIDKVEGITNFEYELSYDAQENGELVPRGAIGELIVEGTKPVSHDVDLGTCSSGTCKYDKGVTEVSVVIRINYANGEVGVAESKISLEE